MTVRHGLDLLERRGLIYRRHGVGTFVSEPKLVQNAVRLTGFFEQTLGQGFVPQSKVLRARQLASGRLLARALDIRVGQAVYEIVRLRSARGVPVVLETSNFPAARFSGLLGFDLARASIYRLMDEHFGGRPVEADQSIEAIAVDPADAELLQIPTGSPVMRLERLARDVTGRPVEHAIDIYRADRSRFTTSLKL
jgi:GntR family transcriptional regulator